MLKEPEIKLFGRKISLPDNGTVTAGGEFSDDSSIESSNGSGGNVGCDSCLEVGRKQEREGVREREDSEEKQEQGDEDQATGELCETTPEDENQNPEDSKSPNAVSESDDNRKTPSNDDGSVAENQPEPENEQSGSTNGQQKTLKKPDKILPCPRCNSMDTKFCYFNNYNVNQPRHLCKSCQRYWTAGGTTRNVPVGAGRRKSKNSGSNFRHIMISEALQPTQIDTPNGLHNLKLRPNGTVLSFGMDTPLRESLASALNLAEKRVPNGARNGVCKIDQGGLVSSGNGESSDDFSMGSGEGKKNVAVMPKGNGFPSPIPCIPGVPWPFPWNSAVTIPTFCPPGYPLPYYMAPFWNYGVPNAWNIPWVPVPSTTAHQNGAGAGAGSMSTLGKHSRNGELIRPNKSESQEQSESRSSESSIVIPKTLRIDDPEDAAKSSIWSTLGIKCDSFRRECLLKALQPKGDEKKPMVTTSPLLQANPAALSRSISFHERA